MNRWLLLLSLLSAALTSSATAGDRSAHWAFQPVRRPAVPLVKQRAWPRNEVDHFVLARLEAAKLAPAPEADRATLIRRLSLDLVGLLPSSAEVEAFVNDLRPEAFEQLVDRLLQSPHFGERWGRHWLDLARYADSDGYEKDLPRPYAYLWRDWVISAFNRDLLFDQFTLEQLAGDQLPNATREQQIATGFHRNTLTNREGGVDQEEYRVKTVKDRVDTTSTVWLGLTIGCANCHSHKYDPISQKEYYGLFAFFNGSQEVDLPTPPRAEEVEEYRKAKVGFDADQAKLQSALADYEAKHPTARAAKEAEWTKLNQAVLDHAKRAPAPPQPKAMALADHPKPPATFVNVRGDFLRPGEAVAAGFTPAILHELKSANNAPTRLDLARWLVDPGNPLTARVHVNRMWQWLFGQPLVRTTNDFGTRGERPSHPELLDWLASEFVARGWSQKQLIKTLVLSAGYRQSSRTRPELLQRDPKNALLARQNRFRLEAELVRDIALQAGGLLNPEVGGPSIRPPLPADIAALGYANSVRWPESQGAERYKRGLYIFFQRTVPYPMLTTFDSPDGNNACTRRERSNTPLQSLTLLNDPVFFSCAQALGRRVVRESEPSTLAKGLRRLFQLTLNRTPTTSELTRLSQLHSSIYAECRANPDAAAQLCGDLKPSDPAMTAAWIVLARAVLNLDEFVTRE